MLVKSSFIANMKFAALNKEASTSTSSLISTPSGKKGRPTLEAQVGTKVGPSHTRAHIYTHTQGISLPRAIPYRYTSATRWQLATSQGDLPGNT